MYISKESLLLRSYKNIQEYSTGIPHLTTEFHSHNLVVKWIGQWVNNLFIYIYNRLLAYVLMAYKDIYTLIMHKFFFIRFLVLLVQGIICSRSRKRLKWVKTEFSAEKSCKFEQLIDRSLNEENLYIKFSHVIFQL